MSGFISAVVAIESPAGTNVVPARPDGSRDPVRIVLGSGLSYAVNGPRVTLTVTSFTGTLTDANHGVRGFSLDGSNTPDQMLHPLATADPEGNAGFLSLEWANNLLLYTGAADPLVVGRFGVSPDGLRWYEDAVGTGREAGVVFAARRWIKTLVADGANHVGKDGDFINVNGGSGSVVVLPVTDDSSAIIIANVGVGSAGVNSGVNTIMGLSSPSLPSGARWLLVGPDQGGDWCRFIAS